MLCVDSKLGFNQQLDLLNNLEFRLNFCTDNFLVGLLGIDRRMKHQ